MSTKESFGALLEDVIDEDDIDARYPLLEYFEMLTAFAEPYFDNHGPKTSQ